MYFSGALPPHEDHIVCRQLYDCMMIFIFTFLFFTFQYELEVAAGLIVEAPIAPPGTGVYPARPRDQEGWPGKVLTLL